MGIARQLLLTFASGLMMAAGARCAEYIAHRVSSLSPQDTGPMPGTPGLELCPQCGHTLHKFSNLFLCGQCGYREDPKTV